MSVELTAHSKNLARLCLIAQEIIEQHARRHDLDMTAMRFELLSLQHEAAFVETIQLLHPSNNPQITRHIVVEVINLQDAVIEAETKLQVVETSIRPRSADGSARSGSVITNSDLSTAFNSTPEPPQIRFFRRRISDLNKVLVRKSNTLLERRPLYAPTSSEDAVIAEGLLQFSQHPFALRQENFSVSRFPKGLLSHYSGPMMAAATSWLEQTVGIDRSPATLLRAQSTLLETLWSETTAIMRDSELGWIAEQSDDKTRFEVLQDQLDQGLRDAIVRQTSPHRMVFVSSENSGKSTFINAVIGENILPTGSGLVTALCCRIVHAPEFQVPELRIDEEYWNSRLSILRDMRGEQQNPQLRDVSEEIKASLLEFEKPTFKLPGTSRGTEEVEKNLRRLNHIVRLFDAFSVPFVLFTSESWATIRLNFPNLAGLAINGHYELVDIPGVPDNTTEFHWNELIMEVMRGATAIIAIVSASQYPFRPWRLLPDLIANATNLRASAVVVTMLDAVDRTSKGQKEWKTSREDIMRQFWPTYTTDPQASGLLLECSVHVGQSLEQLQRDLKPLNAKPAMADIWKGSTALAMQWMYRNASSFQKQYDTQYTLDVLREDVEYYLESIGYNSTIRTLNNYLTGAARTQYHDEEVTGIDLRICRLLSMINAQAIKLGLAPRDLSKLKERNEALKKEGADILTQWTSRTQPNSPPAVQPRAIEACDQAIMSSASTGMEPVGDYLDCDTVEEIDAFFGNTRSALYTALTALQKNIAQEAAKASQDSLERRIKPIRNRISDFDPQSEARFTILLRNVSIGGNFIEAPHPVLDIGTLITRSSQNTQTNFKFRATQERILQGFAWRRQPDERKIEELSSLSRLLLVTISFIPFVLKLPFHTRDSPSRPLQHRLDLQGLRQLYKDLIAQPWADQLSQELQVWLQNNEQEAQNILERAIQAGINASEQRLIEMSELRPTSDPVVVNGIVDSYCNLVAADSALRAIVDWRKQLSHT